MHCHQGKCAVALWGLCFKTGTVPEVAGTSRSTSRIDNKRLERTYIEAFFQGITINSGVAKEGCRRGLWGCAP
jgi:hypothetical protein